MLSNQINSFLLKKAKKNKKQKKSISETSYPKTDITENVCGILTTINECCMLR